MLRPMKRTKTNPDLDERITKWANEVLLETGKTRRSLAKLMGLHETVAGKLLSGKRRWLARDIDAVAKLTDRPPPPFLVGSGLLPGDGVSTTLDKIGVVGVIANMWAESVDDAPASRTVPPVIDPRYPPERQVAYQVAKPPEVWGSTADTYVVTVPWQTYRATPILGDLAVLRQSRGGLHALSLARWSGKAWTALSGPEGGQPIGLVIGWHSVVP